MISSSRIGRNAFHALASSRGVTLIELIITMAVAGVMIAIAVPAFRNLSMNSNVTGTANALVHDLNLARAEAVRRGTLVAVISNAGGWSNGWSVKADATFAADGTFSAVGDPVLRTNPGVKTASGYKVTAAVTTVPGTGITPTNAMVIYTGQGSLIPRAQKYNINVCHPDAQPTQSKWIVIAASGSITTQTDTSSSPAPSC